DVMDRVWAQLYPEFTPSPEATLPNGGPDALAAYLNAETAFRRGDYRTARDGYTRVIRADTGFAIGRLRLALVAAQVDPPERVLDLDPRFSPAIGHLIALANQVGDRPETERLIRQYLRVDSTSVVAEVVGIADTLILGSMPDQAVLLRHVCGHSFLALKSLAFQAAAFGTAAQREGPARRVLRCLEQLAATDQERVRVLRMGLAADLAAGWVDSARGRLGRAGPWAERERDLWLLVMHDVGLPALGDWEPAAARLAARPSAARDSDATAHWALARAGMDRGRHAAALARLAAGGEAPLPASLAADLQARAALLRGDSAAALRLW